MILSVDDNETTVLTADGEDTASSLAAVAVEYPGHAVIDLGATESLTSLDALQEIMNLRLIKFGEEEVVVKEETKKFKFGNGGTQRAASFVELPQVIGGTKVALGVHAIDAPGVPLLLSVRTLRRMGAVIDTERNMMQLRKFSEEWIQLKQSSNEHLLLDMTCDWYHPMPNSASTTAGAYMERSCSTCLHVPHAHDLEPHDFVCAPSHGQEHSELCDSHVFESFSSCPIGSRPQLSTEQTCFTTSPTNTECHRLKHAICGDSFDYACCSYLCSPPCASWLWPLRVASLRRRNWSQLQALGRQQAVRRLRLQVPSLSGSPERTEPRLQRSTT